MKSSSELTDKSATTSPPKSVNSPEFRKAMLDELKDWVAKGHCKLAEGNSIEAPNSPEG